MGNESDAHEPKRWQEFDAKGEPIKEHLADETLKPATEPGVDFDFDGGAVSFSMDDEPPEPNQ